MQRERYADECRAAGVLAEYEELLAAGNPPGAAAMFALQSPPGSRNTDRAFCDGQRRKMERMAPGNRNKMIAIAKKAGIKTDGKFYVGGLGRYDDPKAWVTCADDVLTSCKLTKSAATGVINCDYTEHDKPREEPALAPDLVSTYTKRKLAADPALLEKVRKNPKKLKEVQESVVSTHGRKRSGSSTV